MELPYKTKNRASIWASNPNPGHISRENHNSKRYVHLSVHCSTIYNSLKWFLIECTEYAIAPCCGALEVRVEERRKAAGFLCIFKKNILILLNRISISQEKNHLNFGEFLTFGKESKEKMQMISF